MMVWQVVARSLGAELVIFSVISCIKCLSASGFAAWTIAGFITKIASRRAQRFATVFSTKKEGVFTDAVSVATVSALNCCRKISAEMVGMGYSFTLFDFFVALPICA